jgi:hypothetical protein
MSAGIISTVALLLSWTNARPGAGCLTRLNCRREGAVKQIRRLRQLDCAIRLWLNEDDIASAQTLAWAALTVVRDLYKAARKSWVGDRGPGTDVQRQWFANMERRPSLARGTEGLITGNPRTAAARRPHLLEELLHEDHICSIGLLGTRACCGASIRCL